MLLLRKSPRFSKLETLVPLIVPNPIAIFLRLGKILPADSPERTTGYMFENGPGENDATDLEKELAHQPLEPSRGFLAVRKRMAPRPKYDVDGFIWLRGAIHLPILRTAEKPSDGSNGFCATSLMFGMLSGYVNHWVPRHWLRQCAPVARQLRAGSAAIARRSLYPARIRAASSSGTQPDSNPTGVEK
ncbi:hypothetical protein C8R43DRAFT_947318 [Mycena crocata]|nr:hypothetical protein C8R43DRAFT_947318 [Mycena crocata]